MKQSQKIVSPLIKKEEVKNHPDNKIDQDFPGFPAAPSTVEEITNPVVQKDNAGNKKKSSKINEGKSDGSGAAFEATENVQE